MQNENGVIKFMYLASKLKTVERAGWVRKGIKSPESSADHSFGTALLGLILADKLGFDSGKVVKMALIHDLAEWKAGDITPHDGISVEEKHILEEKAMTELCKNLDDGGELFSLWKEYEERETKEARFVKSLDRLETVFQASEYGRVQPEADLSEFWDLIKDSDLKEIREIYNELKDSRRVFLKTLQP